MLCFELRVKDPNVQVDFSCEWAGVTSVNACQIFSEFLLKDYGGPGTLLVEPFTNMLVAIKDKKLPGAPFAARAALLWAQNYVDQDWEVWNSKLTMWFLFIIWIIRQVNNVSWVYFKLLIPLSWKSKKENVEARSVSITIYYWRYNVRFIVPFEATRKWFEFEISGSPWI